MEGGAGAQEPVLKAVSFGTTVCETWLLTKYAAPGELKVPWNGDSTGARDVALMSAIKVTPGASPIWGISWNSVLMPRRASR